MMQKDNFFCLFVILKNYQKLNSLCDDFSLGDKMKFMWHTLTNNQTNLNIKKISITLVNLTKQKNDQLALFDNSTDCNLKEKNKLEQISKLMCAGHDVRAKGLSPSWADIERSIS